ncbi:unnamed protein product [Phaedon cochleariae]|uniref:BED-type domain-containing protein n=1 Tax=Phaedon cochleariae TaxID=80249 RepID=A0A9N9SJJ5_PHACE|nr:unnamed protein product [Phaedon cochleariae]
MSGRKRDPIWKYFDECNQQNPTNKKAVCKACGNKLQAMVSRMQKHKSKCKIDPEKTDTTIQDISGSDLEEEMPLAAIKRKITNSSQDGSTREEPQTSKIRKIFNEAAIQKSQRKTLNSFVMKTTANDKDRFDTQCARFIFATNLAFKFVEHPEFIKYSEMLHPGYKPPNRKVIGNTLLDQVYQEELDKCQIYLENKTVCLSIDGWSNIRNEPIICACVVNEDGSVFLVNTTDTSGSPHTSEYLTSLTLKIIQDTEKKFKCFVRSVVTDNAANMARMRMQIQQKSVDIVDVNVITYGCSAHILNLLAKDLNVEGVMNNIVRIIKYFRNNHLAKALLSSEGGSSLPLPIEVRWNSSCDSLEAYLKNWHTLVKICEEQRNNIDNEINKLVSNIAIKRNAEDLMARLKPISCALDLMQKENCTIARSVVIWKKLINDLNDVLDSTAKKKVISRYTQAVHRYHFIAHMLSPTNMKENISLTEEEKQIALESAAAEFPNILPVLLRFHGKLSPFNEVLMQESVISTNSIPFASHPHRHRRDLL